MLILGTSDVHSATNQSNIENQTSKIDLRFTIYDLRLVCLGTYVYRNKPIVIRQSKIDNRFAIGLSGDIRLSQLTNLISKI